MIDRDKAERLLKSKGADKPCHRCGEDRFVIIDEYSTFPLQKEFGAGVPLTLGGPVIPVLVVACKNCGALSHHAIGILGEVERGKK